MSIRQEFSPSGPAVVYSPCLPAIFRFPRDTRYFDAAVTRVSVRQRGADLEVVVALRGPVPPLTRQEEDPTGNSVWVLEFPAATVALSP